MYQRSYSIALCLNRGRSIWSRFYPEAHPPRKRSKGCTSEHHPTPKHATPLRLLDQIYTEARVLQDGATDTHYEVFVLEGGFSDFQQLFRVSGFVNY